MRFLKNRKFSFIHISICFFITLLICGCSPVTAASNQKKLNWESINGKNSEILLFMPEGYETFSATDYSVSSGTSIKNSTLLVKYVNGAVLILSFIEGDTKNYQKFIVNKQNKGKEKTELLKSETLAGFEINAFKISFPDYIQRRQFFLKGNRFYSLDAYYRNEKNSVVEAFFESVRINDQNERFAPNSPKNSSLDIINKIPVPIAEQIVDSEATVEENPSNEAIFIYSPVTVYGTLVKSPPSINRVKLKLLLGSSGKVLKIESLSGLPTNRLTATNAAKSVYFLPAEKDGKLVTTWKTINYYDGYWTN